VLDERGSVRRTVTYDLAPQGSDVREIPAVALWYFDPATERYEAARTAAIPIAVRGRIAVPRRELPAAPAPEAESSAPLALIAGAAAVVAAVIAVAALRLRRAAPPPDPQDARACGAAAAF